ncbi:MAG: hypothetical protein C0401_12525 [Anaerolinea sp.]|nr:hypothetical protein [Anaerolinea sp.]
MSMIDIVTRSRKHFFFFVDKCNKLYRTGHDLFLYRELVAMHRQYNDLEVLLDSDHFLHTLHGTLEEWDMNKRGARLSEFEVFKNSVLFCKNSLLELYKYKLYDDIYDDMGIMKEFAERVFCNLQVMDSHRRIVGVSKTLHFLLPDLIMPIDSKYTMTSFYGYNRYSKSAKKEFADFWEIFEKTVEITERLVLCPADVDGELWRLSVPKLIDNAIIGLWNCPKEKVLELFAEH